MRAVTVNLSTTFNAARRFVSIAAGAAMLTLAESGAVYAQTTGDGESIGSRRGR
jgi:hypothetical protein